MTKFLYIADTHLGATPMGFQQQKRYPEKLSEILTALCEKLPSGVDFILHGGDIIDATTKENIAAAAEVFDLAVPVYLCLGNHDLTTIDAVDQWLEFAPQFFPDGAPNYTITTEDCLIHVAPNHWEDIPFYWNETQIAHLIPEQIEQLSAKLESRQELPHIILTHSPVYGLPQAQTGFPDPFHAPNNSFTEQITNLASEYTNIKCILGAHNHLNMRINKSGVEFVTVSSLIETPFEFKLFEVSPEKTEMSTISLAPALAFEGVYDITKSFVQGREIDRSFVMQS